MDRRQQHGAGFDRGAWPHRRLPSRRRLVGDRSSFSIFMASTTTTAWPRGDAIADGDQHAHDPARHGRLDACWLRRTETGLTRLSHLPRPDAPRSGPRLATLASYSLPPNSDADRAVVAARCRRISRAVAAVDQRQRVGIDPRRIDQPRCLPLIVTRELSRLLCRLERDLPRAAVHRRRRRSPQRLQPRALRPQRSSPTDRPMRPPTRTDRDPMLD